jgi:hypothetical protein
MRVARSAAVPERIRLAPGRHDSPRDGACVVELASLIGGEEFSDRPRCVCPVIGAFLRGWNDRAAYADRSRLRPYAERIVGSRESRAVTHERRDMCLESAGADLRGGGIRRALARLRVRVPIAIFCGPRYALRLHEGAGEYAARVLYGRRDVDGAFALLDVLLAAGSDRVRPTETATNGHNGGSPAGPIAEAGQIRGRLNGHGESTVRDPEAVSVGD